MLLALDWIRRRPWGQRWYRRWADSAYIAAGLAALFAPRTGRFRLCVDGEQPLVRICALVVANYRCYGKGWTLVHDADARNGRLDYHARRRAGVLAIAWQIFAAAWSLRAPRFLSDHGGGKRIRVDADRPFPLHFDGDYQGECRDLELWVEPAAARILVPSSSRSQRRS